MSGQSFYQSGPNEHSFDAFAMCNGFMKMWDGTGRAEWM